MNFDYSLARRFRLGMNCDTNVFGFFGIDKLLECHKAISLVYRIIDITASDESIRGIEVWMIQRISN